MKKLINLSSYFIVALLFAGKFLFAAIPEDTAKKLVNLQMLGAEFASTEATYKRELDKLISLEKRLIGQKRTGSKWLLTSAATKQQIDRKIFEEIVRIEKIIAASEKLLGEKPIEGEEKEEKEDMPDISVFGPLETVPREILAAKAFEANEQIKLSKLAKTFEKIIAVLTEPELTSAYLEFIKNHEKNNEIMVDKEGKPIQEINKRRITIIQRIPRYQLLLREYIKNLGLLAGTQAPGGVWETAGRAEGVVKELANNINDAVRLEEIDGKLSKKQPLAPEEIAYLITHNLGMKVPKKVQTLLDKIGVRNGQPTFTPEEYKLLKLAVKEREEADAILKALSSPRK